MSKIVFSPLFQKGKAGAFYILNIFCILNFKFFCVCACVFISFPCHNNSSTVISLYFSFWLYYLQCFIKLLGYDLVNQEKLVDHTLLFILKPSVFTRNELHTKYLSGIMLAVYVTDIVVCYLVMNEKYSILCKY